jgi:hypothetical protein
MKNDDEVRVFDLSYRTNLDQPRRDDPPSCAMKSFQGKPGGKDPVSSVDASLVRDPVDFPVLAAVVRERLLEMW